MKSKLITLLKVTFTVALLSILIARSDVNYLLALLTSLNFLYLAVVFCLIAVDTALRAHNWGLLLRVRGINLSLPQLVYSYMVGNFFGTFLPSSFGTDVGRGVVLSRHYSVRPEETTLAIVMINLMNLLALSICALLSMLAFRNLLYSQTLAIIIIAFCLTYLLAFPFMLNGWLLRVIQIFVRFINIQPLIAICQKFAVAIETFAVRKDRLVAVLGFSFLSQIINIIVTYTVSLALNLDIPLIAFAMLIPIVNLSRMLPISVAGLGAEQGIFVYLFALVAVPAEEALSISLIIVASIICFTALGGIVYTLDKCRSLFGKSRSNVLTENAPK
jgi:glycosyltransferase 2 family protein